MVREKVQGGPLPSSCPGIIPFIDVKWRPRDKIRAKEIYEQWKQSLELQILPDLTSLYLLLPLLHSCTCPPLSQLSLLEPASSTSESWTPHWGRCPPRTTVSPLPMVHFLVLRLREYLRIPSSGWEAKAAPPTYCPLTLAMCKSQVTTMHQIMSPVHIHLESQSVTLIEIGFWDIPNPMTGILIRSEGTDMGKKARWRQRVGGRG